MHKAGDRADSRHASARLERALAGAAEGSPDAASYLFCRFADEVYRYVNAALPDTREADAVTRAAFAEALRSLALNPARMAPAFERRFLSAARRAIANRALRHDMSSTAET